MIKQYQRFFNIILVLLDALCILSSYLVVFYLVINSSALNISNLILWGELFSIITLLIIIYYFMNVYSPMRSRMYRKEVIILTRAHFVGTVLMFSVLFISNSYYYSRSFALLFSLLSLIFILIERFVVRKTLRYLRMHGYNQKHLLIIGAGTIGQDFARKLQNHQDFGYNLVGFLDDDVSKLQFSFLGIPVLGNCEALPKMVGNGDFDEVVVALPLNAREKYNHIINVCESAGVRVRVVLDYGKFIPGSPVIEEFDDIHLLNIRKISLDDPFNKFLKRLIDILVSIFVIILFFPLMICIYLGIKLTSPGPPLFRQDRVGLNNKIFKMLKFRTMHVADDDTTSKTWTTVDDPRKTKFGTFLRKTSLDEFPQFFNVLFGNMSIVGPRPERPFFVDQFKNEIPKYMVKHLVKPGITGWAQVNGWRGDTSIIKRVECDIYYIEHWDILFDLKIVILTIANGFYHKNDY